MVAGGNGKDCACAAHGKVANAMLKTPKIQVMAGDFLTAFIASPVVIFNASKPSRNANLSIKELSDLIKANLGLELIEMKRILPRAS